MGLAGRRGFGVGKGSGGLLGRLEARHRIVASWGILPPCGHQFQQLAVV